jgi:hypothetical protein
MGTRDTKTTARCRRGGACGWAGGRKGTRVLTAGMRSAWAACRFSAFDTDLSERELQLVLDAIYSLAKPNLALFLQRRAVCVQVKIVQLEAVAGLHDFGARVEVVVVRDVERVCRDPPRQAVVLGVDARVVEDVRVRIFVDDPHESSNVRIPVNRTM